MIVFQLCTRIFKQLSSSRACSSIFADLHESAPSTRSRRQPVVHNMSDIEKKLPSYSSLDEMLADFAILVNRAKDAFAVRIIVAFFIRCYTKLNLNRFLESAAEIDQVGGRRGGAR